MNVFLSFGLTAMSLAGLAACEGGAGPEASRLHRAQREYWEARQFQTRLEIYPNRALAEEVLDRYLDITRRYPQDLLPDPVVEPEATSIKIARVGAMAALGAAGLYRELGEAEAAIALLRGLQRPDLPLGALVERKIRGSLASYLRDEGRPQEAVRIHRSLLSPLGPGLCEGDAAFPDPELLTLPAQMLDLALLVDDPTELNELGDFLETWFAALVSHYAGSDAEFDGLLLWSDVSMRLEHWEAAEAALSSLSLRFPDREPWRADLSRARLLAERLGRLAESEAILMRWAQSGRGEAAVAAGKEWIRFLMDRDRLDEVESELNRLKRAVRRREDRAELLYLWGSYELRRGAWDRARLRWGEAATDLPYTPFGLESQLAVARIWAERNEPRFAARALDRLFIACRRNSRHYTGSELANLSLALEASGDSLLGTLPASEKAVMELLDRRRLIRNGS